MNSVLIIACTLSGLAALIALGMAARHAIHLEKCRGAACKPEARP